MILFSHSVSNESKGDPTDGLRLRWEYCTSPTRGIIVRSRMTPDVKFGFGLGLSLDFESKLDSKYKNWTRIRRETYR